MMSFCINRDEQGDVVRSLQQCLDRILRFSSRQKNTSKSQFDHLITNEESPSRYSVIVLVVIILILILIFIIIIIIIIAITISTGNGGSHCQMMKQCFINTVWRRRERIYVQYCNHSLRGVTS